MTLALGEYLEQESGGFVFADSDWPGSHGDWVPPDDFVDANCPPCLAQRKRISEHRDGLLGNYDFECSGISDSGTLTGLDPTGFQLSPHTTPACQVRLVGGIPLFAGSHQSFYSWIAPPQQSVLDSNPTARSFVPLCIAPLSLKLLRRTAAQGPRWQISAIALNLSSPKQNQHF